MADPSFTLLVNSCDKFEDTWEPCFTLLRTFGAQGLDMDGVLLVTETKDYAFDGFDIKATRPNLRLGESPTWSERFIDALDAVRTPLVLYMQDDYFVEKPLDIDLINALARKMMHDPTIAHIGLTDHGSYAPFTPTDDPRLWRIGRRNRYRISTQAGLWRVPVLRSYVRPEENIWMFEIYGTRRAWRRDETFLTVSRDRPEPFAYTHTGIIKGRWHRAMPALFGAHGIPTDFELRGFYDAPPTLLRKWETFRTLLSDPARLVSGLRGL